MCYKVKTILGSRPRRFISRGVRGLIFLYIILCALALLKASAALLHFVEGEALPFLLQLLAFLHYVILHVYFHMNF